jgi:hypothetical protein
MYVKTDVLDMLEIGVCVCVVCVCVYVCVCVCVCVCVVYVFWETEKSVGASALHFGMG